MQLLTQQQINELLNSDELHITPLLDREVQIREVGIDLRLGTHFKVSVQSKEPVIGLSDLPMETFFQDAYKKFGDSFILYPHQLVLASSFEYIKLPKNIMGLLFSRSSLNRLGIKIASVIQPGFAGSLTVELTNPGENGIRLQTGMRMIQLLLYEIQSNEDYELISAKYVGNITPVLSQINSDKDFEILKII
ncbi:dCTP deaminase [Cohnella abietis]|uniref:dCTP deaminase n=1 Tax=Cohnella abietis TaxID=2507935 RepID=A0A3T1DA92_9BACL|nr:dCTP deaminase [Cohnella abietis]BBI34944.1 hypothetical protein KCTCHS21_43430 [Cohnella abietis]